jgi:23S rRNA pseudouridine1911/1915/1917 synthase
MAEPLSRASFRVDSRAPRRLDHIMAEHLPHLSRRALRAAIDSGEVRVNGRRRDKGDLVSGGEVVTFPQRLLAATLCAEADLPVEVLYEDHDLVAVDKPAGMPAVAQRADDRGTLANFLLARFPETAGLGDHPFECGAAHRLDTDTSGVLLVARNRQAYRALRTAFRQRRIEKLYLALVHGEVAAPRTLTAALRASGRRGARTAIVATPDAPYARPARTEIWPLRVLGDTTLVRIRISTGVRHQIRAHLASIGHPVVGDRVYGRADGAGRLFLHAHRVKATHPRSGAPLEIEARMPEGFPAAPSGG